MDARSQALEFESLFSVENLHAAHLTARKGKRFRIATAAFESRLFCNLERIRSRILDGTYEFGPYREFVRFDSKRRLISTSPYRDRVVHWVLYRYLSPIFEPSFVFDSYGNRKNKGALSGMLRAKEFLRSGNVGYVLKIDFSKYFFSVRHDVLLAEISKKVSNPHVFALLVRLVSSYRTGPQFDALFDETSPYRTNRDKGMPIGSLTSQLFANVYLNRLDHFAKDFLGVKRYVRYVDDVVAFGKSKDELFETFRRIRDFSEKELGLTIHPNKVSVTPKRLGIDFLGYRIEPYRVLPRKRTQRKIRHALQCGDARVLPSYYGMLKPSDSHLLPVVEGRMGF